MRKASPEKIGKASSATCPRNEAEAVVPLPNAEPLKRWLHVEPSGREVYFDFNARPPHEEMPTHLVTLLPGGAVEEIAIWVSLFDLSDKNAPPAAVRFSKGWVRVKAKSKGDRAVFQRTYKPDRGSDK